MIKVEPPAKRYLPEDYRKRSFDMLTDSRDHWLAANLRTMKGVRVSREWLPISLGWVDRNPFKATDSLGIDLSRMKEAGRYQCPITEYQFYAAVPTFLLCRDKEAALRHAAIANHYAKDMLTDAEWMRKTFGDEPDQFARAMLGTGHTAFFRPNDGGGSIHQAHFALDNGDLLAVAVWHWFNK